MILLALINIKISLRQDKSAINRSSIYGIVKL